MLQTIFLVISLLRLKLTAILFHKKIRDELILDTVLCDATYFDGLQVAATYNRGFLGEDLQMQVI